MFFQAYNVQPAICVWIFYLILLLLLRESMFDVFLLRENNFLTGWQDESGSSNSSAVGDISTVACDYIFTQGRAWAISITQRTIVNEEISRAFN